MTATLVDSNVLLDVLGDENADRGLWTMNDGWFGEHVFEIAVRRDALPAELQAALSAEPVVLPAWDPMGALAR